MVAGRRDVRDRVSQVREDAETYHIKPVFSWTSLKIRRMYVEFMKKHQTNNNSYPKLVYQATPMIVATTPKLQATTQGKQVLRTKPLEEGEDDVRMGDDVPVDALGDRLLDGLLEGLREGLPDRRPEVLFVLEQLVPIKESCHFLPLCAS
ncbi:hypothetical protein ISN44_As10g009270 [Arabidopsis suecica]|uniref:Uncharacterized protein n=1 Tax=Arabidopsis suecica TaxID=45249 RepID=A0A8T1ZVJ5_ARASU|nr:hypothetical protein ISN44_As10g009270 [Arabidopsis suecica]